MVKRCELMFYVDASDSCIQHYNNSLMMLADSGTSSGSWVERNTFFCYARVQDSSEFTQTQFLCLLEIPSRSKTLGSDACGPFRRRQSKKYPIKKPSTTGPGELVTWTKREEEVNPLMDSGCLKLNWSNLFFAWLFAPSNSMARFRNFYDQICEWTGCAIRWLTTPTWNISMCIVESQPQISWMLL